MSDRQDHIPHFMGMRRPENALPSFVWRAVLALGGIVAFGASSKSAALLAVPFLWLSVGILTSFLSSLAVHWARFGLTADIRFGFIGPLAFRTRPFKWRLSRQAPIEYFLGPFFSVPGNTMHDLESVKSRLRFVDQIAGGVTIAGLLLALKYGSLDSLKSLLLIAINAALILVTMSIHQFTNALKRLPEEEKPLFAAQQRAMPYLMRDELSLLPDHEINALIQAKPESGFGLNSLYLAFLALDARGQTAEAASLIRSAVEVADQLRSSQTFNHPTWVAFLYQDAAYYSAAYAGDTVAAMRLMSISGEQAMSPVKFHAAMTAIWIRLADRSAALTALEAMKREQVFERSPNEPDAGDRKLGELQGVFATNSLSSLTKPSIGRDFFAGTGRPIFARATHMKRLLDVYGRIFPVFAWGTLIAGAIATDQVEPESASTWFWTGLLAYFLFIGATSGAKQMLQQCLELTYRGIVIRAGSKIVDIPWEYVTAVKWSRDKKRILSIDVDAKRLRSERKTRLVPRRLLVSRYRDCWPTMSIEEALRTLAPQLFVEQPAVRDEYGRFAA